MLDYESTAEVLKARILALIPANPAILELESCWDLFRIPGFDCNDLGPSMAQAAWALARAKREWQESQDDGRRRVESHRT